MRAKIVFNLGIPHIRLQCMRFGYCDQLVTQGPPRVDTNIGNIWHWNGNEENPTILPSVNCANRCGGHWIITNGEQLNAS